MVYTTANDKGDVVAPGDKYLFDYEELTDADKRFIRGRYATNN